MSTADQESSVIPPSGHRLALVVGVNGSPQIANHLGSLQFAENSATTLALVLQKNCNFELFKLPLIGEQATTAAVRDAIGELAFQRSDQDFLLFYFAGHGYPISDEAGQRNVYLVTRNFNPSMIEELGEGISLSWLSELLYKKTKAGSVLIILDCCYGGNFNALLIDQPLDAILDALKQYFSSSAFPQMKGKIRATLSAAGRDTVAWERDSYSVMAKYLLDVLDGKYLEAVDENGQVTLERLKETLSKRMLSDSNQQIRFLYETEGKLLILATLKEHSSQAKREREQAIQRTEREQRLRAMFSIPSSGLMQNRYASFVGRENEMVELRQYIDAMKLKGGYVTLIEPPGKGKSSIIAKLVHDYSNEQGGLDRVAYHFIPLTPEADHPVVLLRDLLAHLVLKHDLFEIDVASENRAVLSQAFSLALKKIHEMDKQEVIFIDGLDQLEIIDNRTLSFLPREPDNPVPSGIVFVLGTRPKLIHQVSLFTPSEKYPLPNLSRTDFDLILQRREVALESNLADSFYDKLEQNALYLDLVAKELAERHQLTWRGRITEAEIATIIRQIADNPENLFSLATDRLRMQAKLWEEVMKPVLGLLLVTNEPLSHQQIKQLINLYATTQIDGEQLHMGLEQLGGLIIADGHQRYTLFHLKLRDYLREDPDGPNKHRIFDRDDELYWHQRFVVWCEQGGLARIWGDVKTDTTEWERRRYARHHYIFHLYSADDREKLFNLLDDGTFGKAKNLYDPSTRSYALDLDLGRKAGASEHWDQQEAIQHLPHLWRYTLLRCSLASRADKYPVEAFRLMLLLEQEPKSQGLAELITDPAHKVEVFALIASHIATSIGRDREAQQMLMQAEEIAKTIADDESRIRALVDIASSYALTGQEQQAWNIFQQAEDTVSSMKQGEKEIEMLIDLASAYAFIRQEQQVQRLTQQINEAVNSMNDARQPKLLTSLASAYALIGQEQQVQRLGQQINESIKTLRDVRQRDNALATLASASAHANLRQQADEAITSMSDVRQSDAALTALVSAYAYTERWQQADTTIKSILDESWRITALIDLALAYVHKDQLQQAQQIWQKVDGIISTIRDTQLRHNILGSLATAYVYVGDEQQTEIMNSSERVVLQYENPLITLAKSYSQTMSSQGVDTVVPSFKDKSHIDNALFALVAADIQNVMVQEIKHPPSILENTNFADTQAKLWEILSTQISSKEEKNVWQFDNANILLAVTYAQADDWPRVEASIASIRDENWREKMWVALTSAYVQKSWWQRAEAVLSSIQGEQAYDNALSILAIAYAQTEQWQQSEAAIASLSDQQRREEALAILAIAYAHAGLRQQAEDAISLIQDEQRQDEVLVNLPSAYAQAGLWQQAEATLPLIHDEQRRDEELSGLPVIYAQAGLWQRAEEALPFIRDVSRYNQALIALVSAYAEAKQWQQAEDRIHRIQDKEASAKALTALADAFAKNNEYERLLRLIHNQWLNVDTRDQAIMLLPLAFGFISSYPDIGIAFRDVFTWVDDFLRG